MALSILAIGLKGTTSPDSQRRQLGSLFGGYIEETSASAILTSEPSPNQLAETNSLAYIANSSKSNKNPLAFNTIQENSLVSRTSILTDIFEQFYDSGNQINTYTVQEGDTLSFIASDYGVSVDTIIWANNLKNANDLRLGQELKIPPISGVVHLVRKGDTIDSIAKKYSADKDRIISFNNLAPDGRDIQIDDEIIVPDGKIAPQKKPSTEQPTSAKRFAYLPNLSGYFLIPTSGFNWGRIHGRNGIDIANSCGTPIYAAADGSITAAKASGYNGGFGKYIKIGHPNGTETLYAHASQILVAVGQYITKGQEIALIGTTGRSTGCHLHFEVHGAKNPLAKY